MLLPILVFLVMDALYISIIKNRYIKMVKQIQCGKSIKYNLYAVFICYFFLIIGLLYYVIPYAQYLKQTYTNKLYIALISGGLFGIVVYGVLCTFNMSMFQDFYLDIAIMDTIWGGLLYTVAVLVYLSISK